MRFRTQLASLRFCPSGISARGTPRRPKAFRLHVEALDERTMPSTFTVTNLLDSGAGSLRAAVAAANANPGADAINFATTGTIGLTSGQLDITDSVTINGPGAGALTVSGNHASRVFGIAGNPTVTIADLTVADGFAWDGGGAIHNTGVLSVSNCSLSRNESVDYGGAIYNDGTLTVSNSTLSGNYILDTNGGGNIAYGGAIYMAAGTLFLNSSTLSNNTAIGGFSYYTDSESGILNAFVATDAYGGALYIAAGTVSIDHSTIAGNAASVYTSDPGYPPATSWGGGIYIGQFGALQVHDSILADNTADFAPDLRGFYGVTSLGNNLIGNTQGGSSFAATDLLNVNPQLGPLQDNGGPTRTMALLPGSPALDAGDSTGAPAYDQRGPGFPRVLGGAIDIGAVEGQTQPPPPALVISDVWLLEGNSGTTAFVFTVSLSAPSNQTVSVYYATADGSATAGSDYQSASGTLTIPAGQTTGTITVLVNGDRLGEPNETFFVNLSSATNAIIADGQGVGTILDDEPRISISDVTKKEGRKGQTTSFTFTVTLSSAYDQAVTMSFRTVNGTAKTSDNDYVAKTGTLTFAPGETTKTITIEVKGDSKKEADEDFYLDLSGLSGNALFTKSRGVGTILNDD
jgi:hypothetical protein